MSSKLHLNNQYVFILANRIWPLWIYNNLSSQACLQITIKLKNITEIEKPSKMTATHEDLGQHIKIDLSQISHICYH